MFTSYGATDVLGAHVVIYWPVTVASVQVGHIFSRNAMGTSKLQRSISKSKWNWQRLKCALVT